MIRLGEGKRDEMRCVCVFTTECVAGVFGILKVSETYELDLRDSKGRKEQNITVRETQKDIRKDTKPKTQNTETQCQRVVDG